MNKIILNKQQTTELIEANKYKVNADKKFVSRCIDGRYENKSKIQMTNDKNKEEQMPAMAVPGADAGELALIFATANSYGFEVDAQKAWKSLVEVVGGEKNLQFHTDSHAEQKDALGGCGHIKLLGLDSSAYSLTDEQVAFVKNQFSQVKAAGISETKLQGDHQEGAVFIIRGNWGVYPQGAVETELGKRNVMVFMYHQTLSDARRKILASTLIKHKAVILPEKCDSEYLFTALCEMGENHLLETSKRLAKGLPIFSVAFTENGEYKVEEIGEV